MRVAVVTTSFPRAEGDPSGHFVLASAQALARSGADVHVVAPGGSVLERPRERWGLTVHPAGGGSLFGWPGALARAAAAPWRLAAGGVFIAGAGARLRRLGRVDRIVAHWLVPSAWPIGALAIGPSLEAIGHGGDVRLLLRAPSAVRARLLAAILDRADRLEMAARSSLDALARSVPGGLAQRLLRSSVIRPPPLDVPDVAARAAALRASVALAHGEILLSVACRLVAFKRVDLAIDAAAALEHTGRRAAVVVVGDGPERRRLEGRASAAGARIRFVGAVPRTEALAWIAASDALVHASATEAAPSAVREARALGVPVVATAAGDVAEWARHDAGISIAAPSARAIADAIAATLRAA